MTNAFEAASRMAAKNLEGFDRVTARLNLRDAHEEIESLRLQLKITQEQLDVCWSNRMNSGATKYVKFLSATSEAAVVNMKLTAELDEWKRRANVIWESHRELGREVADWFDEEKPE